MYTGVSVRRFLQPVAACVLLLIGGLPATTLACQWACVPLPAGHAHHHEADHQVGAGISITTDGAGASLTATEQRCDHAKADSVAISPTLVNFGAPVATAVSTLFGGLLPISLGAGVVITAPSPPGTPPQPFSLRI